MDTPSLNLPDPVDVARTLQATLGEMPQPLFAVLDGALFDDLPGDLLSAGFSCRSLFLEHGDKEVERAGPWLFALDNERARAHAEALALAQPCAVFWSCPEGEMALWRHLRTLNEVMIPIENSAREETDQPAQYERVMFRHWDPNVIAQVLPVLDENQFVRFFGPGTRLVVAPGVDWARSITVAARPEKIEGTPGLLKLSLSAIRQIETSRIGARNRRIVNYLRKTLPPSFSSFTDSDLSRETEASLLGAARYGVTQQAALSRWSYLYIVTGGAVSTDKNVEKFMHSSEFTGSPDQKVRQIMTATIHGLKAKAKCL
jgi:hypothetical protein